MDQNNKKITILHEAIDILRKNTDLTVEIEPKPHFADFEPDAVIRIAWQDLEYYFDAEIKNVINRATLGGAVRQLDLFQRKGILVTRYVTPQIADELKKMLAILNVFQTRCQIYFNQMISIMSEPVQGFWAKISLRFCHRKQKKKF